MDYLQLLFYIFIVTVTVQSTYYLFLYSKLAFLKPETAKSPANHSVSVIVCAKNEAENLKNYIPLLANQDYPDYEIVLVNDGSTDSTLDVMQIYSNKYTNISVVDVEQNEAFWGSKKFALTLGIKAAKHDYLLLTDADCWPLSRHWINQMASNFENGKSIVLGYGAYEKKSRSLLNMLIRFETLQTAVQYLSYALNGMPYMGVGRNLAYNKEAFFNNNGFVDHMDIPSGDDDLFINQIATKDNVAVTISPFSFTKSEPETSLNGWFRQKQRHITTSYRYKLKHKILLSLFYITQALFWITSIMLFMLGFKVILILSLFFGVLTIKYIIMGISARKLMEKDLIAFLPLLELFLICFQFSIFIANLLSKEKRWK